MNHQPIYLDNAATTKLAPEVLEAMMPFLTESFGNPSSIYSHGRQARMAIETARKTSAQLLGVPPSSITFTSCGTESNNTAVIAAIRDCDCNFIITSPIEHPAVLRTIEYYSREYNIPVSFVGLTENGHIDYYDLESQLVEQKQLRNKCFVSLMHANNETGAITDIERIGKLCRKNKAIFHSDCVQTIGHYPVDLAKAGVHFASASAHKFHGPKGTGLLYIDKSIDAKSLIYGGGQEKNMRAGTENVSGIIGFSKALELSLNNYEEDSLRIEELKNQLKKNLQQSIPGINFNSPEKSLYTVVSVCFPKSLFDDSLIMNLDLKGIAVSGGSACSSGKGGSHVMKALGKNNDCHTIRFSFSKYNSTGEIDDLISVLNNEVLSLIP